MEQLPIIIDGKTCGQLTVRREGAYMLCRGRADWQGGLLRLWLYGRGEPVYVGVLQPDGSLRKKFSLREYGSGGFSHCGNRPMTDKEPTEDADVLWYLQADGTLLREEDGLRYIAFPADGVRLPAGWVGVRRVIEGREYVVFPC